MERVRLTTRLRLTWTTRQAYPAPKRRPQAHSHSTSPTAAPGSSQVGYAASGGWDGDWFAYMRVSCIQWQKLLGPTGGLMDLRVGAISVQHASSPPPPYHSIVTLAPRRPNPAELDAAGTRANRPAQHRVVERSEAESGEGRPGLHDPEAEAADEAGLVHLRLETADEGRAVRLLRMRLARLELVRSGSREASREKV